jgi:GntR family transcriptional regulator, transcriptional repressor for pyruvate dehydrogenase complex
MTEHGSDAELTEPGELSSGGAEAGAWEFHPIANARAHEAVIEQITFAIRASAFAPGDRLPPIDSLSRTMKVSKPVIGEALKVLSRAGVLRVQRGINGGQTVLTSEIPEEIMALSAPDLHLSVPEILEARRPVEIQLAILAGERASEADFGLLDGCIQQLRSHRQAELDQRIRFDHLFHYNIGRAARSRALAQFQHQILEQLFLKLRLYFQEIEDIDAVIELHEETLTALRTRKKKVIERAINRHLQPLEHAVMRDGQGAFSAAAP